MVSRLDLVGLVYLGKVMIYVDWNWIRKGVADALVIYGPEAWGTYISDFVYPVIP